MQVIRDSREISGELDAEQLFRQLMKSVTATAGAAKAFLILPQQKKLSVAAEWDQNTEDAMVLLNVPLEEKKDCLCEKMISYVENVKTLLVLPSACQDGLFVKDPYIAHNQVQSVLCLPLIHKGALIGILYLENAKTKNAFTFDRVEILRLLSPEIALAIDNALLYTDLTQAMEEIESYKNILEKKVDKRSFELTRKNRELEDALKKLHQAQNQVVQQEKLAALGFFTQGLAHEIQNPLNFVNNFSEIIVDEIEETAQRMLLKEEKRLDKEELVHSLENSFAMSQKVYENGTRIKKIVDLMLQHGQIKGGEFTRVSINDLLHESSEIAYHDLLSRDQTFDVKVEEDLDEHLSEIEAIPQDLSRVFFNVIHNALYFAFQKKTALDVRFTPTVQLKTKPGRDYVEIFIRDNGGGIPEEMQDDVLTQFFTTKPVGAGTGLGLSLSHDIIVHGHGGKFFISSSTKKEGSYTEVYIRLPSRFPK